MRAKMASALAVKSGCSLLQRSGLTWLVAAMTGAHSARSPPAEATIWRFPVYGPACGKHTGCGKYNGRVTIINLQVTAVRSAAKGLLHSKRGMR